MEKRVSALILIVLLSSTLGTQENQSRSGEGTGGELHPEVTRIEISPDPNSVQDLGSLVISEGKEVHRGPWADSSMEVLASQSPVSGETTTIIRSGLVSRREIGKSLWGSIPEAV